MTGSPSRSAAAQNGSNSGSSSRRPAIEVPTCTPTAPAAAASSSTGTARSGAPIGRCAIQRSRSGRLAANAAMPWFAARAIRSPASAGTS
jgi:hypothetical protein